MFLPLPSLLSSSVATILRIAPSMELMLSDGQSSRISCFVKRLILFIVARLTISSAGSLVSTNAKRSRKSLCAKEIVNKNRNCDERFNLQIYNHMIVLFVNFVQYLFLEIIIFIYSLRVFSLLVM